MLLLPVGEKSDLAAKPVVQRNLAMQEEAAYWCRLYHQDILPALGLMFTGFAFTN